MFYVLEGVLTMRLRGRDSRGSNGELCLCAAGGRAYVQQSQRLPGAFLNMNTPSGFEHYMRELGVAAQTGPLTPEVMGPIASRYDFEPA